MLALLLLALVVALGVWLARGRRDPAEGLPLPAATRAESGVPALDEGGHAPQAGVEPVRDPQPLEVRSDAPDGAPPAESVDLWVRVVETVVDEPRRGERRPTRRGIAGMSVSWDGALDVVSDRDGLARFAGLEARSGELRVEPQGGLHGWSGTLDLAAPSGGLRRSGARLTYEVELRPNLGFFRGVLLDSSGAPVDAAWVALVRGGTDERRSPADDDLLAGAVQSDAHGEFELPRVQGEERLELLISTARAGLPAGHVRPLATAELASPTPLNVRLPAARGVTVRVLTADGSPAQGRLCLQRDGARWPADCEGRLQRTPAATQSNARAQPPGELRLELDDGPWVVHYLPSKPGGSRRLFQFTLAPGGPTRFDFQLP